MTKSRSRKHKPALERDDDASNVLFSLWRVSRAARALVERSLESSEMSGDEFGIYSLLCEGEEITPSELENWMSAPATTVSSYMKRIEARGHVSRSADPDDGRSFRFRLTPAGVRAHAEATATYLPLLERVVEQLGAREPSVRRALRTLRRAITAARSAKPSPPSRRRDRAGVVEPPPHSGFRELRRRGLPSERLGSEQVRVKASRGARRRPR